MRITVSGCGLAILALASCAPVTPASPSPTSANPASGVILAVRPVPDAGLAQRPRLTPEPAPFTSGQVEYVVRTGDGITLAVVQEADPQLRPGAAVTVSRGGKAGLRAR